MSLFAGFYIVSLLGLGQLIGLIFIVRAINRLCDEVSITRTVTLAVEISPLGGTATSVVPRTKPEGTSR